MSFNPAVGNLFPNGADPFDTPKSDVNPFKTPRVITSQSSIPFTPPPPVIPRRQPRHFTFSQIHIAASQGLAMSVDNYFTAFCYHILRQNEEDNQKNEIDEKSDA